MSAEEKVNNSTTWKQTFQYDRYGNRRFNAGQTTTLAQSTNVTNPEISTSTNRLTTGYSYDKAGNLTVDAENRRFVYDAENHQTKLFNSTNNTSSPDAIYQYDGDGKRVRKISSTETVIFVYDGSGQLVAEYSTELSETPQVSYLTSDHLGSPRVITNELGAVTNRKDYMAFGEETQTAQRTTQLKYENQTETRKGYTGYEKDEESGLDFAQARYYNSSHGRYTSVDPLTASANVKNPQTFNRYSYVLNSPYKYVDPLGLISVTTGACGQCGVEEPGSGGGYQDVSGNFLAQQDDDKKKKKKPIQKKQKQNKKQKPPKPIKKNVTQNNSAGTSADTNTPNALDSLPPEVAKQINEYFGNGAKVNLDGIDPPDGYQWVISNSGDAVNQAAEAALEVFNQGKALGMAQQVNDTVGIAPTGKDPLVGEANLSQRIGTLSETVGQSISEIEMTAVAEKKGMVTSEDFNVHPQTEKFLFNADGEFGSKNGMKMILINARNAGINAGKALIPPRPPQ